MIDAPKSGNDFGGIGPTHGSASQDLPQQPTTPKVLSGTEASTAGVNLWDVTAQGDTYDGATRTVITGFSQATSGSGVVTLKAFGWTERLNAAGVWTKAGPAGEVLSLVVVGSCTVTAAPACV